MQDLARTRYIDQPSHLNYESLYHEIPLHKSSDERVSMNETQSSCELTREASYRQGWHRRKSLQGRNRGLYASRLLR